MNPRRQNKIRIDRLLVERGHADSRQKAQALILAGKVLVDEQKIEKCGTLVNEESQLRLLGGLLRYVSRAGLKLEAAIDHFGVDPKGKICLDIGASTGGFTDCLLQRGASRVIAVDAGTNQLDWKLRQDPRVTVMEQTNARYLGFDQVGTLVELVTMDVSFISSTLILPVLPPLLEENADLLVLVKPQFEVGLGQVGKGGIVRDPLKHRQVVEDLTAFSESRGWKVEGCIPSPVLGQKGNQEFLIYLTR